MSPERGHSQTGSMRDQPLDVNNGAGTPDVDRGRLTEIIRAIQILGQQIEDDPSASGELFALSKEALRLLEENGSQVEKLQFHLVASGAMLNLLEADHPQAHLEVGMLHCMQAGFIWNQCGGDPIPALHDAGATIIGLSIRYLPFVPEEHIPSVEALILALSEDTGIMIAADACLRQEGLAQLTLARLLAGAARATPDFEQRHQALESAGELSLQAAQWLWTSGAKELAQEAVAFNRELQQGESPVPITEHSKKRVDIRQCPACGFPVSPTLSHCQNCGLSLVEGA